jgi:uncharacterized membrane protein
MNQSRQQQYYVLASASLIALIVLGFCWELWLAPAKPGGSFLALKVLPLLFPLPGILRKKIYTMQWSSMFIMFYFIEGVVRAFSDLDSTSRLLAGLEIVLALVFFMSTIFYVKPFKKIAKEAKAKAQLEEKFVEEIRQP